MLAGGLFGAVSRPIVVTVFWLTGGDALSPATVAVILLGACGIGFVIGSAAALAASAIARSVRHPALVVLGFVAAASLGAWLAYSVAAVMGLALCILTYNPTGQGHGDLWMYFPLMALTGALSGVLGGLIQIWMRQLRPAAEAGYEQDDRGLPGRSDIRRRQDD